MSALEELGFEPASKSVAKAKDQIYKYQNQLITPLQTFSWKMNQKMMFLPGDTFVCAGRSGVGKSAFANQYIKSLHDFNDGILTLYFSLEMNSWRQIMRYISEQVRDSVSMLLKRGFDPDAFERIKSVAEALSEYEIYFWQAAPTAESFLKLIGKVRAACPDMRIMVIYDHTRLIRSASAKLNEEAKIRELMEAASYANNEYDTFNVFLSQMNRNIEQGDMPGNHAPGPADIFGSDAVMQFADHVMALHRPEMYSIKKFDIEGNTFDTRNFIAGYVLKQRDGWTGTLTFTHNLAYNQIWDRESETTKKAV